MINFDTLPSDIQGGYSLIPNGRYKATVNKAEMKVPKSNGKPYLVITWDVVDESGKSLGKVFDNFFESQSEIPMYKLKTFVDAIGVVLKQFELKDLVKVSVGKTCEIAINVAKSEGYDDKNQINVFDKPPYAPIREVSNDFINVPESEEKEIPFAEEPNANSDESY